MKWGQQSEFTLSYLVFSACLVFSSESVFLSFFYVFLIFLLSHVA